MFNIAIVLLESSLFLLVKLSLLIFFDSFLIALSLVIIFPIINGDDYNLFTSKGDRNICFSDNITFNLYQPNKKDIKIIELKAKKTFREKSHSVNCKNIPKI